MSNAKFINLRENAGQFQNDEGNMVDYHNFTLMYLDERQTADSRGDELNASTNFGVFEQKISADKISAFFGVDVVGVEQFSNCYLKDLELVFGRKGLIGVRFIESKSSKA